MMSKVEKIFNSLSFYLQDIVLPLAGYYAEFRNPNYNNLSIRTVGSDIIGRASMNNFAYVNPVIIYPSLFNRVVELLGISVPSQANFISSAQVVGINSSKVEAIDYRTGYVLFSAQPSEPVQISYGAKVVGFKTTPPETPEKISPPEIALLFDATTGAGGSIGTSFKFMTDHFIFDIWGRNDTEVIRLGSIVEQSLRVSIPIIDFEVSGYPLGPNSISGKGMEPRTFDPVSNTIGWARLEMVNFQKLEFPGAAGVDRHRGTGRVEILTVR